MKPTLWTVLALSLLVGESWCQRSRDRPPTRHQQQQQQQSADDDAELTDECPEPNGYFADGYQCDKYYECKDGAITEKLCPDGMVFNDFSIQHEKCDLPFNIDCSQRSALQDPKPSTNCPRQNGYFAHNDVKICDKFYFCVDGKFNMITCPAGLVYNEKTGICTWPDEAKKKHCSSEEDDPNRIRRVAFWKSDEESSRSSAEDVSGSFYDSEETGGRKRKLGSSAEYGSVASGEYPDYDAGSGSGEADYGEGGDSASYGSYDTYDDPEFSNFDREFQDFVNKQSSGIGYPGFTPHDFIRRKKDSYDELDGYIKGYVDTIGKDPKAAAMGMDEKYLEKVAEEVVEKEMEEEEKRKQEEETRKDEKMKINGNFGTRNVTSRRSRQRSPQPVYKSQTTKLPTSQLRKNNGKNNGPANPPYTGPVLTLRKPVNGVKWSYIPKPGRHLAPPPTELAPPEVFKFECPKVDEKRAQQHPRYPDPEDCQFFYVCINGEVPRRNGCKIGQVFNEASGSCDWPRNVPECKEWYKGILTDEELDALEHPKPKVRNSTYTAAAQKRKRPHQSVEYDLRN